MFSPSRKFSVVAATLIFTHLAFAGGPRWVAGSSYFNASVKGQPVHWKNGAISYYLDQGALTPLAFHSLMTSLVAQSASVWNNVPTAAVSITNGGSLNEDVSGANVSAGPNGITMPADIQPTATSKPLGIVYDADGSVINAFFGAGASAADDCRDNGVMTIIDNVATDGTIQHALMILNGLCAGNNAQLSVMQYQMVRAFGRILGLDWSQANESMFVGDQITADGLAGWPIMHPVEYVCSINGIPCTPNGMALRYDDIAAVNRMYPITTANQSSFPGKKLTAAATISVKGTIHFRNGQGMQGVNVVLRPLKQGTNTPDIRYTVAAVSGSIFQGAQPNPVNGSSDNQGNPFNKYGSDDQAEEGWFDLSGVPLPIGTTIADYQLTFESLNPLYALGYSVGPYTQGQVSPSGAMPVITLNGMTAGLSITQDVVIQDSADESYSINDGNQSEPAPTPPSGEWTGRITGYGHTGWFTWPVRPNRELTIETVALDESGHPSLNKARPVLGAWSGTDANGTLPVSSTAQPFNGDQAGLTTLSVATVARGSLTLGVADSRGDGRPDYLYHGRLLYADSVMPTRISLNGGPITIRGIGFRPNSVVTVNGISAAVTSVTPTEITAIAPPANGAKGVVLLTVSDPATLGVTAIQDGLSYDALGGDALGIVTAPLGAVATGVPTPFTVKALSADDKTPAAGITVTFTVTEGTAALGCGQSTCSVLSGGDGLATMNVSASSTTLAQVTASLSDGASVITEFTGSTPPAIAALTPNLYIAIGATAKWSPQAEVLSGGVPVAGQSINWSAATGTSPSTATTITSANGVVSPSLNIGPLPEGADATLYACLPGNTTCATFQIYSVHPQVAQLVAVSGAGQALSASETPNPVVLRVTDAVGHPMAGGVVTFYETLRQWTPDCPTQGRCPSAPILAMQTVQATSGADGSVTLTPLTGNGVPTRLDVTAVTGSVASLNFEIEQHP
ncbi:IPT/TIG domain-containing protein [Alloacidobacterium dinghuense]|uniref:IPT/TIG domain-containing protein n=1 Tax=Alloacidobacterium dinghuense TaxID=2763107 RepID=A0A7G8BDD6_9BACT|nr:IPT/TIG domain-containing protein [Alloacidobacterium dinghuense]QNI30556.1 IPT/TIG domain-containing protein [Alloacidobacterium dinghuense]